MMIGGGTLFHRANAETVSSATCAKPAGVIDGDIVVVVVSDSDGLALTTTGGDVWPRDQHAWSVDAYDSVVFTKRLTATDVVNGWTFSGPITGITNAAAVAFGSTGQAFNVAIGASAEDVGETLTLAPPTGIGGSAAVAIVVDRDPGVSPVAPEGMTKVFDGVVGGAWKVAVALGQYHGPNPATWTGLAGGNRQVGWLLRVGS